MAAYDTRTGTTHPLEPESASLPQYPRQDTPDQCDTELVVTAMRPGSHCDRWLAITVVAAITTACNETRAGSGRDGNGHYPPVCISYPEPGDSHQGDASHLRSKIDQLLGVLDLPRRVGQPMWEEEGDPPQRSAKTTLIECPSFLIAQKSGQLVLTRWGHIYQAPQYPWQQSSTIVQGGATW